MSSSNLDKTTVDIINDLIQYCRDGERGYKTAADRLQTDPELKADLLTYSTQRAEFANQLQRQLTTFGIEPAETGTIAGALHRGWIDVRQAIAGNERDAIVAECVRGDEVAVKGYRQALSSGLPVVFQQIVESQYRQIEMVYDKLNQDHNMHVAAK